MLRTFLRGGDDGEGGESHNNEESIQYLLAHTLYDKYNTHTMRGGRDREREMMRCVRVSLIIGAVRKVD